MPNNAELCKPGTPEQVEELCAAFQTIARVSRELNAPCAAIMITDSGEAGPSGLTSARAWCAGNSQPGHPEFLAHVPREGVALMSCIRALAPLYSASEGQE
jgi:hypothetical protein